MEGEQVLLMQVRHMVQHLQPGLRTKLQQTFQALAEHAQLGAVVHLRGASGPSSGSVSRGGGCGSGSSGGGEPTGGSGRPASPTTMALAALHDTLQAVLPPQHAGELRRGQTQASDAADAALGRCLLLKERCPTPEPPQLPPSRLEGDGEAGMLLMSMGALDGRSDDMLVS